MTTTKTSLCIAWSILMLACWPSLGTNPRALAVEMAQGLPKREAGSQPVLSMTPAVAVTRVDGLDRFILLPDAELTNSDKLKVYFRPLHFKIETDTKNKQPYRAKFTEDGRIRRKGEKTVLAKEDKLLEYETRFDTEDYRIFLVNTIGLETLSPGDYELDITLHDLIDGQASATQSLPFRIVPSQAPLVEKPKPEPETPQPAKAKKARAGRGLKRPN